jgi:hypothetical protein
MDVFTDSSPHYLLCFNAQVTFGAQERRQLVDTRVASSSDLQPEDKNLP